MPSYHLFCLGHPLLDLQVSAGEALLEKYGLQPNHYVLASKKQASIYEDIAANYDPHAVAGGSAQNTARGAAYVLPPDSVVFTGCVGDDKLAEELRAANAREGVHELYQVVPGQKTGVCAVIITGHDRSLVTDLRVARSFDTPHLESPLVAPFVAGAEVFYVEGFILSHGVDVIVQLGKQSSAAGKTFALNISAPFIPEYFSKEIHQALPYCDFLFANESEAEAYAKANDLPNPADIIATAKSIAKLPKANPLRPRVVVFTQGSRSTVLVSSADVDSPQVFPVTPIPSALVVDTNAAGDAFAGGFLGGLVAGKELAECVRVGHDLAAMCVQQNGAQYRWPKVQIL